MLKNYWIFTVLSVSSGLLFAGTAVAEVSAEELAKLAQNPIANLISVPFQNNINFNVGPYGRTQDILNIQPVVPIKASDDWNIITRTIFPLLSQPGMRLDEGRTDGLGDVQFSAFLSPAKADGLIWGVGMIGQVPTHTDEVLGNKRWGLGPTAVALRLKQGDPWVYGALVNNVWSVSQSDDNPEYNNFLAQPFVNYNFGGGLYLASAPLITADWKADSSQQWTVPLGGGVGKIFHLGRLPVNTQLSAYGNVVHPDNGPDWQLRFQVLHVPKVG